MANGEARHAFVSYVHEDGKRVDQLCKVLEAAQIPYWRDRKALAPGDAWKAKIRDAIKSGSLVFLACFSDNSRSRDRSHMNEELTLAVEEFRKMPPGRTWLIPVRFDEGDVPDWDLGAGRSLRDLNYADLFGEDYAAQVAALITAIGHAMGPGLDNEATARAAIDQVEDSARSAAMKRLTKEMLPDPSRRIQLDDIVAQEVRRIVGVLTDESHFPGSGLGGTQKEQIAFLVRAADDYWRLVEPFCASLQVAARWASVDQLGPWVNGLRALVSAANKIQAGNSGLVSLRHVPAVAAVMTAGLACTGAGTWANLRSLVVDPTVEDRYERGRLNLINATDPWRAFDGIDIVANALARSVHVAGSESDDVEALAAEAAEGKLPKYYTPVADWLHAVLRPVFADQFSDDEMYGLEFDRAEVMLGLISQHVAGQQFGSNPERAWLAHSRWFGRSTWRSAHRHGNPVGDLGSDLEVQRHDWPPVRAGLFSGAFEMAHDAWEKYADQFNRSARNRF